NEEETQFPEGLMKEDITKDQNQNDNESMPPGLDFDGNVIEQRKKINEDGSIGSIFGICSICQEQIVVGDEITIIADCLHPYHKVCILPWFESKLFGKRREEVNFFCPNCRYQIKSLVLGTIAPA
ncbi:MAG: hypothetical protein EZS28_022968, partial [Streblomastix strix]